MMARRKRWLEMQLVYIRATEALRLHVAELEARLGQGNSHHCSAAERRRRDLLTARVARAQDACMRWLDQHSPRGTDWHSGVATHWICAYLSEEQALSETPEALPPAPRRRKAGF